MAFSALRHVGSIIRKRRPIHLTFFVTRRCNARCRFCFYLSEEQRRAHEGEEELSLSEIESISTSMGKLLWLAFSGGEIFLRKDLEQIAETFYRNNSPVHILLPTNGLLPDRTADVVERILRTCSSSTVTVKLSLDGPEAIHDSLRGVYGAYRKVKETCRLLSGLRRRWRNLEIGINTVLCAGNQEHVGEVRDMAAGMEGVSTHTVSLIRGSVADPSLKEVSSHTYERIAATGGASRNGRYGFRGSRLKSAQDALQKRSILETMVARRRSTPCFAGRLNIVLAENGDVYPCEMFSMNMGNVRERGYSIPAVLASTEAKGVLGGIDRKDCWCTHECYHMTNIFFSPARYPALAAEYTTELGRNLLGRIFPVGPAEGPAGTVVSGK